MGFLGKIVKPVKKAAKAVKKGAKHVVKQGKRELIKVNPSKAVKKGIDHAVKEIKQEVEKEMNEKYNHILHHVYDMLADEIVDNYDKTVKDMLNSNEWEEKCVGIVLRQYKTWILTKVRSDLRKSVMEKLEK